MPKLTPSLSCVMVPSMFCKARPDNRVTVGGKQLVDRAWEGGRLRRGRNGD